MIYGITRSATATVIGFAVGFIVSLVSVAMIALGLAWELWLAPTGSGTLAVRTGT